MNFKKTTAALTASVMMLSGVSIMPTLEASAADTCVISTATSYQTIQGFGGINHPEWIGDLTDAQVQKAFGNGEDELGFTILRVYVNDDSSQWSRSVNVAKKAQALGATVFATPWNPPASMRIDGDGTLTGGKYQLDDSKYAEYAQHLNSYVKYMEGEGVDLYSISVQNEPDYAEGWTYWSTDELTSFIAEYGDDVTAGTNAKLMSPESFQYRKDMYNSILNNSTAYNNIDLFGTHFYGTTRSNMDFPALEASGKPIWMTEVYVPNSSSDADTWPEALDVAENIHNGLTIGNMSAYVWWYIRRSYGPIKEDGNISKRGYMMAQYSKYVRPGDVRIDATEQPADNVYVSAYKGNDGQVTIVAVNKGTEGYAQKFTVESEGSITDIDRYRTTGSENLAETQNLEYTDNSFWAQLPAESVSTFVVTLGADVDSDGYYFHDTFEGDSFSWDGKGDSTAITSGRTAYAGSESLLIQERTAAWNGAFKSLNTTAFLPGNTYSFSVNAMYFDGDSTEPFYLKLQYTDANGETRYSTIAEATALKGEWVQLANTSYTIPEDASNLVLLVETADSLYNFYIDEAIGAPAGTEIAGAGSVDLTLGDVNADGSINIFDLSCMKIGLKNGFDTTAAKIAADVDQSGTADTTDAQLLQQYIAHVITEFPVVERNGNNPEMQALFNSIKVQTSYKKEGQNNPLYTQRFGADPGVMEYDGRVYVYMTNDVIEYDSDGNVVENTYNLVNKINCISSDDLVNWTDHGAIEVAGSNGAAKWASKSWAPCAAHKTINGKEKFFLYFCNGGNGVSVLTADSPTGPWTDPLGHGLITRSTPNCSDVKWLFDPAVFVDDDGTGYLCFGGGVPDGMSANPGTARIVKLGADMISLAGDPQTIDAPYLFEDSGINKIGDKYYYTYCSNWSTSGNSYGMSSAAIQYMVSDSPMGPYTYGGELFKNIGTFFGTYGNNHHSIVELNGKLYLFYHARAVETAMGITGNYRSPQVNELTMTNGKFNSVTGTMTGVSQLKALDPYTKVQAETMSNQAGINVSGLGDTVVTDIGAGDWIKVNGASFSKGASSVTIRVKSSKEAAIKICTGTATGTAIGYAEIPNTNGSFKEITVPVDSISGTQDICFVFSDAMEIDWWQFS